jgi:hypothetical protein
MEKIKKLLIYCLVFSLSVFFISCAKEQKKPAPKSDNEPKPVPPVMEEIELEILGIMKKVDLIPYYERQIAEKKKKIEEKKQMEILTGKKDEQKNQGKQGGGAEGEEKKDEEDQSSEISKLIEFKPEPITINDTVLADILKEEMAENKNNNQGKIPDTIVTVWHEINNKVKGLHEKWNSLEPELIKENTPHEAISGFENTLNSLTVASSQYKYMETLMFSNKLTSYIPDLISNFKKKTPNQIYHTKYFIRDIVLNVSNNDYTKANETYKKLVIYKDALISQLAEKNLSDVANKLNTSIADLQNAINLKNISIIKIKASVVMKNVNSAKEELSK